MIHSHAHRLALSALLLAAGLARPVQAAPPDSPFPSPQNPTLTLTVDATDAPRRLLHVQEDIPAGAGPLTLVYPKWLPGEHAPNGPITNVANVVFTGDGQVLPWRRDLVDLFAFHLNVPGGVRSVHAAFDLLLPSDPGQAVTSENLADIVWTSLVLYPQGRTADGLNVAARLRLPGGWKFATALPLASQDGDTATFQTAPLVTLLDSPLIAGQYAKVVPLTGPGDAPPVEIDMVADSPEDLDLPDSQITAYKNLVREADTLWGARHYRDYHFLYTLSDLVHGEGLEHHESSQDSVEAQELTDNPRRGSDDLFAHEYTHSWNGKYRRPYDLYTTDYQQPMRDDLLWVYEGMTQFYGDVLTARSGLWTPEDFRDDLAATAARLDHEPGRGWRPLVDTAVSSQILYGTRGEWQSLRRGVDYYDEMVLVWLEADTIIRRQTGGRKSLDDFARLYAGGTDTPPLVKTYTLDDIVRTLNAVTPYDWRGFLTTRVYNIAPRAPLGGLAGSGWKLVYDGIESEASGAFEKRRHVLDLSYSLGMSLGQDGRARDVIPGTPAAQAGLAPGMTIIAVNDRRFSNDGLKSAVRDSTSAPGPIRLLVENGVYFRTYALDYHRGLQYPHLARDPGQPDLLTRIIAPLAAAPPTPSAPAKTGASGAPAAAATPPGTPPGTKPPPQTLTP